MPSIFDQLLDPAKHEEAKKTIAQGPITMSHTDAILFGILDTLVALVKTQQTLVDELSGLNERLDALCTEAAFKGEPFKALRTIDETPRKYKV